MRLEAQQIAVNIAKLPGLEKAGQRRPASNYSFSIDLHQSQVAKSDMTALR
jgi:hypothetical protein